MERKPGAEECEGARRSRSLMLTEASKELECVRGFLCFVRAFILFYDQSHLL